jgi:hypothetical protein
MNKTVLADTYLVNTKEILKSNTTFTSVDAIENYLVKEIEKHPVATYIATFDHYVHTASLKGGMIPEDIKAAKNVLCCFGMAIPNAVFVGIKPMSMGIVETTNSFVFSFIEAPAPSAQQAMSQWIAAVENK